MDKFLIYGGFVAGVLLIVKYMMGRARTDSILSRLQSVDDDKKKEAYQIQAALLTQEIEDAKIDYKRIRDKSRPTSTGGDTPGS